MIYNELKEGCIKNENVNKNFLAPIKKGIIKQPSTGYYIISI